MRRPRGLVHGTDDQMFAVSLPRRFRALYDRILLPLSNFVVRRRLNVFPSILFRSAVLSHRSSVWRTLRRYTNPILLLLLLLWHRFTFYTKVITCHCYLCSCVCLFVWLLVYLCDCAWCLQARLFFCLCVCVSVQVDDAVLMFDKQTQRHRGKHPSCKCTRNCLAFQLIYTVSTH